MDVTQKGQEGRVIEIDMLKGFAALCVAVGHLALMYDASNILYRWIFQFHMPAFFLTAGFCASTKSLNQRPLRFFWKKFKQLMIPDYFFRLFMCLSYCFRIGTIKDLRFVLSTIPSYLWHYSVEWFMPTMLMCYVGVYLFAQCRKRMGVISWGYALLLCAFTPFVCSKLKAYGIGDVNLFVNLSTVPLCFSFMLLGNFFREVAVPWVRGQLVQYDSPQKKRKACLYVWILALLCVVLMAVYIARNNYAYVNLATVFLGDSELLLYFCATAISLLLIGFFHYIYIYIYIYIGKARSRTGLCNILHFADSIPWESICFISS